MSTVNYDAVIVGGGLAGLTAGLRLAKSGRKVAVIAKGDPACSLSTGCIDVLGAADNPLAAMAALPAEHPYRLAGPERITAAIEFFRATMAASGLNYHGELSANRRIMTPIGSYKTTCLVPESMAAADPAAHDELDLVAFTRLKDFFPAYIQARQPNARVHSFDAGATSSLAIAARLDDEAFRAHFIDWLKGLDLKAGKLCLPAVLGLEEHVTVLAEIRSACGGEVFEIPTLPPSLPGLRLFKHLKQALQNLGGDLYWGREIAAIERQKNGAIEAVTLKSSGRAARVQGRAFILASGAFVSGGLYAEQHGTVIETVFNLPTHAPAERESWFKPGFFERGHPIESAGVRVDERFKPLESDYPNLWACGSVLAHGEITKHQCGHGLAIATGYAAAMSCEEFLA
ncbi:MAG: Anaerobic glycerol-3-phosphate dehydrogenase subunit B [Deltaproteobacteria bacterium ADurb.Bin510]|jgi:glycerol-3-phosphate dehydrogenase subunit B|nr:MAG: Anaerobic glycerol-3-phosphate dehydrogenase subunit B [Deltaproteobacteria bacterium ADurb.Bin510]